MVTTSSLVNTLPKTALITSWDDAAVEGTLTFNVSWLPVPLPVAEGTLTFDVSWIPLSLPLLHKLSDSLSLTERVDKDSPLSDIESAS